MPEEKEEKFNLIPPEVDYLSTNYRIRLPVSDKHLQNPWKLRIYAAKHIERKVGDYPQLTSLKVRQPSRLSKTLARLRGQEPEASVFVTVKF
jgi:hypothetical protein